MGYRSSKALQEAPEKGARRALTSRQPSIEGKGAPELPESKGGASMPPLGGAASARLAPAKGARYPHYSPKGALGTA